MEQQGDLQGAEADFEVEVRQEVEVVIEEVGEVAEAVLVAGLVVDLVALAAHRAEEACREGIGAAGDRFSHVGVDYRCLAWVWKVVQLSYPFENSNSPCYDNAYFDSKEN